MAPRREDRGVAASAAIGPQFSSPAVGRTARHNLRDLLDAARALSSSPAGSPLRPGDQLQAAVEAFNALDKLRKLVVEKPALLRLLWEPAETRAALLRLHAQLLKVLASPTALAAMGASERARHLGLLTPCCNTLSALLRVYDERADKEEEPEEAVQAASVALALRTDLLPASCALLAAGRQDPLLLLPTSERTALAAMLYRTFAWCTVHPSLHSAAAAERYGRHVRHVRQARGGQGLDAGGLLVALARCRAAEHLACIMLEMGLEAAAAAVAAAPRQGQVAGRAAAAPQGAKARLLASQAEWMRAQLVAVLYCLDRLGSEAADTAAGAASCSNSVTSASSGAEAGVRLRQEEGQQHISASAAADARRAILSGPCLQYALAAHVVAQLAAADGGARYGLAEEQTLLPDYEETTADTRPARQRPSPPAPRFLCAPGLIAALRLWTRCRLHSPPVPLAPVSCSGVRTLALRLARVAMHSADHHMAMRQQPQQQPQQQQWYQQLPGQTLARSEAPGGSGGGGSAGDSAPAGPASGDGGPRANDAGPAATPPAQQAFILLTPVQEAGLVRHLAFEALKCAALTMRRPPVLYGGPLPPAGGEDGAADAAAAEWWGMAVQAVRQALGRCVEDDRIADLSAELLPEHVLRALTAHVPPWPAGDLPHSPPPNLAVALSAGCLPLLERAMRTLQHSHEARAMPATISGTAHLSLLLQPACAWPLLGRLMAYGEPRQVAALLATSAKLIGRLSEGLREEQAAALSRSILSGGRAIPAVGGSKAKDTSSSASEGVLEVLCELPLPDMLRLLAAAAVERQQQDVSPSAGDDQAAAATEAAAGSTAGTAAAEGGGVSTAAAVLPPAGQVGLQNAVGEGSPPARAGLKASLLPVAGPPRQLASMIAFAARRWLPALSRLAMADGSTLAVGAPGGSEPPGLAVAGLVLPWLPALVHAAVQQEEGEQGAGAVAAAPGVPDAASGVKASTPAACVSPAAWRLFLLADVDVVGLLGRTLQGLGVAGGGEGAAGSIAPPPCKAEAEVLHKACVALECVAAAFPREVAAALADGRLPRLHRAPEALLGGAAGVQLPPEQRQQRERLLLLLSALDGGAAETSAGASAASLPDPCVDGEGTAPASKVGALLLAAATPGEWDALLPTCSNPLCASLAGGSEADLTLRACGGCGRPRYCCADCQRAHWRAGHKGECAPR